MLGKLPMVKYLFLVLMLAALALGPAPALAEVAPKDATDFTKQLNAIYLKSLPFDDRRDFEDAQRGFIAPLYEDGVLKNAKGEVIYKAHNFQFDLNAPAPDTVNPSLWRQSQINGISGLFKVADRIYQVRGQDISNITFIEGDSGIIVIDPLISAEAAASALKLYYEHRPQKPVKAVIYTHSHTDHYGGVRGIITNDEDVKSGKIKVIAPAGFLDEAISENVLAGNAMTRRAVYSYSTLLPQNAKGNIGNGLGVATTPGSVTLIPPTDTISETGQKMTIDGLEFEFLMAPGSEAPAEMHFYIAALKALCTAENCVHTLHNFYTLRGAKTRDVSKWVGYLNETLDRWGAEAEVLYAPHTWPVWGNDQINEHIENYRDAFKYIHDQALHLANQGYTINEIGNMLELPESLAKNWATRGYYGSVSHNARAVYNFYLGYYDGNPANLNPYSPVDMAERYVNSLGGEDKIMGIAREALAAGDYRWAAELLKHVVFYNPQNQEARNLQADAFEQMGYQAENATWRGFYLTGAQELRNGIAKTAVANTSSPDTVAAMPLEMILDYLAVRLNSEKAAGKDITLNFKMADNDTLSLSLKNSVLNYRRVLPEKAAATFNISRDDLHSVLIGQAKLDDLIKQGKAKVDGDPAKLAEMLAAVDEFEFWFNIVTPNAPIAR